MEEEFRNCENLGKSSGLPHVMYWELETILFWSQKARPLIPGSYTCKELWALTPLSVIIICFSDIWAQYSISVATVTSIRKSEGISKVTCLLKIKFVKTLSMSYGEIKFMAIYLFIKIMIDSVKAMKFQTLSCTHTSTIAEVLGKVHWKQSLP